MSAPTFLRLPVGASIAGLVAWKLGMSHPEWAAMGAAAALQGVHLHSTFHRALQRVAGTLVGAVLIWLVLTQEPTVWSALALLVGLQLVTEVVIGFNYALGQVFVTPMALLMTYMASPGASGASMALERVLDTVVGVVVGIAVSIIISTRTDRHNLHEHHGM